MRAAVNQESGKGDASRSSTIMQGDVSGAAKTITVTASAPGLGTSAPFTIPLSIDLSDSVLAVASASVGTADVGTDDM